MGPFEAGYRLAVRSDTSPSNIRIKVAFCDANAASDFIEG
jgi:hypothetical protein